MVLALLELSMTQILGYKWIDTQTDAQIYMPQNGEHFKLLI